MSAKNMLVRPELGQVWTPTSLAIKMARDALAANGGIRKVLDPACGPATFSDALYAAGARCIELDCYDVDERMMAATSLRNRLLGYSGTTKQEDYLAAKGLASSFDLVIMNPPYIRHEEISQKAKSIYHKYLKDALGEAVDKRANLFSLFLLKGIVDLVEGGILCAIVYDAITQSRYGKKTLEILSQQAELLSISVVRAPFEGVLVDAQILLYRKRKSIAPKKIESLIIDEPGCVSLETLLDTRRGTSLPVRKGYLAIEGEPYFQYSVPFFIKQNKLAGLVVKADTNAYLAECLNDSRNDLSEWLIKRAEINGLSLPRVSIKAVRGRIAFNYYIRNSPRHLWNSGDIAIADNFYVSSTKGEVPDEVAWILLNSDEYLDRLISAARNQGNGLKKLQLYEYRQVNIPDWRLLSKVVIGDLCEVAKALINEGADYNTVRAVANRKTKGLFNGPSKSSSTHRPRKHSLSSSI